MDTPSFIVVDDALTLAEAARIEGDWARTPTGKFNAFTTAHDVY
jgi:nitrite reductase (NO-forming)/hydroxylamine reductase